MLTPANPVAVRVLLGFLKAARVPDQASSVLLLATVLFIPASTGLSRLALGTALLLGLLAKYLAWRLALDAEFFALLADNPAPPQLQAFDDALAAFLERPVAAEWRPMASRLRGTRRLLRWQAATLGAQVLALLASLLLR